MQIGDTSDKLRLTLSSTPTWRPSSSARGQLKGALLKGTDPAAFQGGLKALSSAARTATAIRGREAIYQELGDRLTALGPAASPTALRDAAATPGGAGLQDLATQLNDVRGILEGAVGPRGAYKDDELLTDLRDALDGLFATSEEGQAGSLGDLGLSVGSAGVYVDADRLKLLKDKLPDTVAAQWPTVVSEDAARLLTNGAQALQDKQNQAPLELRLAEQAVHVKAELTRLHERQQALLFQQAAFEERRNTLQEQKDALEKTQQKLDEEPTAPRGQASPTQQAQETVTAASTAPQPPGLLSFGLAD
jgi:hypothetical protein